VGIDPVTFWRLTPRALTRIIDGHVQRFRAEHGIDSPRVLTDPDEMERAMTEMAIAGGAARV
jgi:hypothetical protein